MWTKKDISRLSSTESHYGTLKREKREDIIQNKNIRQHLKVETLQLVKIYITKDMC